MFLVLHYGLHFGHLHFCFLSCVAAESPVEFDLAFLMADAWLVVPMNNEVDLRGARNLSSCSSFTRVELISGGV